jgi:hypothetical protein
MRIESSDTVYGMIFMFLDLLIIIAVVIFTDGNFFFLHCYEIMG